MGTPPDYFAPDSKLAQLWDKPLAEVAALPNVSFTKEEAERHRIYLALLMAIVRFNWNGNKNGARDSDYPDRKKQQRPDGTYLGDRLGDRYLGHNIGALAVDGSGRIVDFDLNHNKVFNSSVQHAEARLIRRLFGLAAVQDSWDLSAGPRKYRTDLNFTTLYTSLESCAQCSGIMALANLKSVFYLQPDPGQYMVGQIMRNLSDASAPVHIPASATDLPHFDRLVQAYKDHQASVSVGTIFWKSLKDPSKIDMGAAITSFLCTDKALDVYTDGAASFDAFTCGFPDYAPVNTATGVPALSNSQVLGHARQFLDYVGQAAQRGTPHFN